MTNAPALAASRGGHWIPPLPLAAGIAFQLAAWIVVIVYAFEPSFGLALAWVHAVALGWLTLTALSVLLHVVPAFTDLVWRGEAVARVAVLAVLAGAVALAVAFAAHAPIVLDAAAAVLALAIVAYVAAALRTLAQPAADRTSAAIARALSIALGALVATVLLGAALARAYAAGDTRLLAFAPSHALLGIGAWLTVLVSGVSAQTFRPMLGARSRSTRVHVVAGGALFFGPVLAALGAPASPMLLRFGVVVAAAGAVVYAIDALDIVSRATTPHPPVRAFVVASVMWLLAAALCALATAWGAPFGAAAVVAALAGWLGQMVNAHLHHIGVRVVTTLLRGDDDETRPWEVLDARLTWCAFVLAQLAVFGAFAGVAFGVRAAFVCGGLAGCASIAAIVANVATARRNVLRAPLILL